MPDHVHHVIDKEPEPPRRCACRNSTVSTCGGSVLQQACAAYRTRVCSVHSNTQHATRNTQHATPMRMPPLHTVHVLPPVHVNVPVHRIHWRSCSDARNTSPPKLPPSSNEAHWLVGLRLRACFLSDSAAAEQHTCAQALTPAHAPVNPGQPLPLAYPTWAVSGVWDYKCFHLLQQTTLSCSRADSWHRHSHRRHRAALFCVSRPLFQSLLLSLQKQAGASSSINDAARGGSSLPLPPTPSIGSPAANTSFSSPLNSQGTLLATSFSTISTPDIHSATKDSPGQRSRPAAPHPSTISSASLIPNRAPRRDLAAIAELPPRPPRRYGTAAVRASAGTPSRASAKPSTLRMPRATPSPVRRLSPSAFSLSSHASRGTGSDSPVSSPLSRSPLRATPASHIPNRPVQYGFPDTPTPRGLSAVRVTAIPPGPDDQLEPTQPPQRLRGDHLQRLSAPWPVATPDWSDAAAEQPDSGNGGPRVPQRASIAWESPPHIHLYGSFAGNTSCPSSPGSSTLLLMGPGTGDSAHVSANAGLLDASCELRDCGSTAVQPSSDKTANSSERLEVSGGPGLFRRLGGRARSFCVSLVSPRKCCGGLSVVEDDASSRDLP